MSQAFSRFAWPRAEGGYTWVTGISLEGEDSSKQWFLTDNVPLGKKRKEKLWENDVDPRGLFRRFAQISLREVWTLTEKKDQVPATQNNPIVTFAKEYGPLTSGVPIQVTQGGQRDADNIVIGESLTLWQREIESMGHALHVVDNLRVTSGGKPDLEALGKVIVWGEGDAVAYMPQRYVGVYRKILSEDGSHEILWQDGLRERTWQDGDREIIRHKHLKGMTLKRGEVERTAWLYLRQAINEHLSQHVFPHFAIEKRIPLTMRLQFTSTSLLGWMWLQLAQFVDKGEFRKCLHCGTPFVVAPTGGAHSNRQYCKDSCRVMACRKRSEKKDRARVVKIRGTSQGKPEKR